MIRISKLFLVDYIKPDDSHTLQNLRDDEYVMEFYPEHGYILVQEGMPDRDHNDMIVPLNMVRFMYVKEDAAGVPVPSPVVSEKKAEQFTPKDLPSGKPPVISPPLPVVSPGISLPSSKVLVSEKKVIPASKPVLPLKKKPRK